MKERLIETAEYFFISTALINAAMFVCGMVLAPEQRFGYELLVYPIIYGFLGCIPVFVMFTSKELTVKQTMIRESVQLVLIIAIVEMIVFGGQMGGTELIVTRIAVGLAVVAIYFGAALIRYKLDEKTARKMTDQLKAFQESAESAE